MEAARSAQPLEGSMHPADDHPANTVMARSIGLVSALLGLGLAWFSIIMIWRQLSIRGAVEIGVLTLVCVVFPIAWFCTAAGLRLAFNRPNRYGSIAGPWTWRVLAAIFVLVAIAFIAVAAMQKAPLFAAPAMGAAAFGILCFRRARMLGHSV
jgi:hypothetical protein